MVQRRDGQAARARILDALRRQPGLNKNQLCKAVGMGWATVEYHLRILEGQGAVRLVRPGRRAVWCFPVGVPARYQAWLATLVDEDAWRVLEALGSSGGMGIANLGKRLGMPTHAVRRILDRLLENGMVMRKGQLRPRYLCDPNLTRGLEQAGCGQHREA